jgi:predicted transposase YdaD
MNLQLLDFTRTSGKWEKSRLKLAPKLRDRGMSVQEMAELLEIDIEVIRKYLREDF